MTQCKNSDLRLIGTLPNGKDLITCDVNHDGIHDEGEPIGVRDSLGKISGVIENPDESSSRVYTDGSVRPYNPEEIVSFSVDGEEVKHAKQILGLDKIPVGTKLHDLSNYLTVLHNMETKVQEAKTNNEGYFRDRFSTDFWMLESFAEKAGIVPDQSRLDVLKREGYKLAYAETMSTKPIDDIVSRSGIAENESLKLREALVQLDSNYDGNLDSSEVSTSSGYLSCNPVTENWWYYTLGPVENALYKSGLIEKLRNAICPKTYDVPPNKTVGRKLTVDREDAVEVLQREYAITRPGNQRSQYLQTFGAGPCVVLTLYDPITKTGVMAHIDSLTNLSQSLGGLTYDLSKHGVDITKMEARLVGGDSTSQELVSNLHKEVVGRSIEVVEVDCVRSTPASVMLDTSTGDLFDYGETIHVTPNEQIEALYFSVVMPGPLNRSQASNILSIANH